MVTLLRGIVQSYGLRFSETGSCSNSIMQVKSTVAPLKSVYLELRKEAFLYREFGFIFPWAANNYCKKQCFQLGSKRVYNKHRPLGEKVKFCSSYYTVKNVFIE